MLNYNFESLKN